MHKKSVSKLPTGFSSSIVGVQHYPVNIKSNAYVDFVREPDNEYDSKAIKVVTDRSEKIGYVPKSTARWLSPIIDHGIIGLDGTVGRISRSKSVARHPVAINVRILANERIEAILGKGELDFESLERSTKLLPLRRLIMALVTGTD